MTTASRAHPVLVGRPGHPFGRIAHLHVGAATLASDAYLGHADSVVTSCKSQVVSRHQSSVVSRQSSVVSRRSSDFVIVRPVTCDLKQPHKCAQKNQRTREVDEAGEIRGAALGACDQPARALKPGKESLDLRAAFVAAEWATVLRQVDAIPAMRGAPGPPPTIARTRGFGSRGSRMVHCSSVKSIPCGTTDRRVSFTVPLPGS
jgi:hypothetical protein